MNWLNENLLIILSEGKRSKQIGMLMNRIGLCYKKINHDQ